MQLEYDLFSLTAPESGATTGGFFPETKTVDVEDSGLADWGSWVRNLATDYYYRQVGQPKKTDAANVVSNGLSYQEGKLGIPLIGQVDARLIVIAGVIGLVGLTVYLGRK